MKHQEPNPNTYKKTRTLQTHNKIIANAVSPCNINAPIGCYGTCRFRCVFFLRFTSLVSSNQFNAFPRPPSVTQHRIHTYCARTFAHLSLVNLFYAHRRTTQESIAVNIFQRNATIHCSLVQKVSAANQANQLGRPLRHFLLEPLSLFK